MRSRPHISHRFLFGFAFAALSRRTFETRPLDGMSPKAAGCFLRWAFLHFLRREFHKRQCTPGFREAFTSFRGLRFGLHGSTRRPGRCFVGFYVGIIPGFLLQKGAAMKGGDLNRACCSHNCPNILTISPFFLIPGSSTWSLFRGLSVFFARFGF